MGNVAELIKQGGWPVFMLVYVGAAGLGLGITGLALSWSASHMAAMETLTPRMVHSTKRTMSPRRRRCRVW